MNRVARGIAVKLRSEHCLCDLQTKPVTDCKISDTFLVNQVYEKVRDLGLPYEIKESGGSVLIKIALTPNINQLQFHHPKEKFRFLTTRTLHGSQTPNWRAPKSYNENSVPNQTSFPDISFFRNTPTS